jgi:hypothetical protein
LQSKPGLNYERGRNDGKRDKGEASPVDPPALFLADGWIHTLPVLHPLQMASYKHNA